MRDEIGTAAGEGGEAFTIVETAIGAIGLAWSRRGLTRVQLPLGGRETMAARLEARGAAAAERDRPGFVADAVALLDWYARGERTDFDALPLDLGRARGFDLPVWTAARQLAWGEVVTYGELTRRIGGDYVARAVGQALGRNPVPIIVPCHRIVAAGHRIGGFSAPGGSVTKEKLLALEGVKVEAPEPPLLAMMGAGPVVPEEPAGPRNVVASGPVIPGGRARPPARTPRRSGR